MFMAHTQKGKRAFIDTWRTLDLECFSNREHKYKITIELFHLHKSTVGRNISLRERAAKKFLSQFSKTQTLSSKARWNGKKGKVGKQLVVNFRCCSRRKLKSYENTFFPPKKHFTSFLIPCTFATRTRSKPSYKILFFYHERTKDKNAFYTKFFSIFISCFGKDECWW